LPEPGATQADPLLFQLGFPWMGNAPSASKHKKHVVNKFLESDHHMNAQKKI
jgi:hypothetical protein